MMMLLMTMTIVTIMINSTVLMTGISSTIVPGECMRSRKFFSSQRSKIINQMDPVNVLDNAPDHFRQHHIDGFLQSFFFARIIIRWGDGDIHGGTRRQGLKAFDHRGVFRDEFLFVPDFFDDIVGTEL